MQNNSPALSAFIASYKRRRLAARLAWGLFAATGAACLIYSRTHRDRVYYRAVDPGVEAMERRFGWAWAAAAVGAAATWVFARCPECRRYIGVSRYARAYFTAFPPCELEQACADELAPYDEA